MLLVANQPKFHLSPLVIDQFIVVIAICNSDNKEQVAAWAEDQEDKNKSSRSRKFFKNIPHQKLAFLAFNITCGLFYVEASFLKSLKEHTPDIEEEIAVLLY